MRRVREDGVALINVLVVLGLAATLVYAMLTLADLSIARSQRFSEAGQALALIRAGEQSAIAALRRDMADAPETDHAGELWAAVGQTEVEVAGGAFALEIADARDRFDLNAVAGGGLRALETFRAIAGALELAPEVALRIAASLTLDGPLRSLEELGPRAGVEPADVARLVAYVTALPTPGEININAVSIELLAVLLKNPATAGLLGARRERAGFLAPGDLAAFGVLLPPGIGFTSDLFRVRTTVRIGDTVQSMTSLLLRREGPDGVGEVVVIARENAMAAVSPPPPSS